MSTRRAFLLHGALAGAAVALARASLAQERAGISDTSNLFVMDQSAARSVRLNPKPGAMPSMVPADRDALERRIRCQCGCTLDVYACRTTDFTCQVSPAMHRDVLALVQGGYSAQEILDAFVNVYGERALMAPPPEGFNRLAYLLPVMAMAVGAVVVAVILRRWSRSATPASPATAPAPDASDDALRRLDASRRDDS